MRKYFATYNDTEGVEHRFEIADDNYTGSPIEITGYVVHEYLEVDDVLEAIRGSALKLHLDASENLTFEDLYSEQERTFKVNYYQDGVVKFKGWLNPDGLFQDWVNDRWEIELDISDGLGFLQNLSFELVFSKKSEIEILSDCLLKTGLSLEIYTNIITRFTQQPANTDVLALVLQNTNRFIEKDGETNMPCEEIVRGILEKYCASIFQFDGKWFVVSMPVVSGGMDNYYVYNSNGTFNRKENYNLSTEVGSQINDFYPHHCNANQQIEIQPSIGAYRISYKYGPLEAINDNPGLINDGTTLAGWNIITPSIVDLDSSNNTVDVFNNNSGANDQIAFTQTITTLLPAGKRLKVSIKATAFSGASQMNKPVSIRVTAGLGPSQIYYLNGIFKKTASSGLWRTNPGLSAWMEFQEDGVEKTGEIMGAAFDQDAIITIDVKELPTYISSSSRVMYDYINVSFVDSPPVDAEDELLELDEPEGEFHTFQRISNKSSVVRDNKEAIVGDNSNDPYVMTPKTPWAGALYFEESGSIYLTNEWSHGDLDNLPILQIMGHVTMEVFQKPAKIFKGDVYGRVKYGAYFIDGIQGRFVIMGSKYNSKTNITEVIAVQVFDDYILDDTKYTKFLDYGDTSRPTID